MTAVLVIEAFAILLLAVLVVGLLRSHADILRALHDLGVGDPSSDDAPPARSHPRAPERTGSAPDISGVSLANSAVHVGVANGSDDTLLAFLSTGCSSCLPLWQELQSGVDLGRENTRLVVVAKGPEAESESRLRELTPGGTTLVRSTEAWERYQVPVSPYFVFVEGNSGAVAGEGSATSWEQVTSLMNQALADAALLHRSDDSGEEFRADAELRKAGIGPGHSSLYPDGPPHAEEDA